MEPSLDRIAALVDVLGEPHRGYPVVHLTGTNGKTSTARMVDALLTEIGLRTGRYTSPHLQRATERINVDNRPITPERYVELYRDVLPFVEIVDEKLGRLSKFEVLTGMGFAAFADAPVEAGVVEVGLGGRWDATNVVDAQVAVITPIGLDHAEFLGVDVLGIAREKAGIIKPGSVAVLAAQESEVAAVLLERCVEVDAQVAREGAEFGVAEREIAVGGQRLALRGLSGMYDDVFLPLHGEHQASNAALALAAVEALIGAGPKQPLDPDVVRAAFAAVRSPGRLERLAARVHTRNAPPGPTGSWLVETIAHGEDIAYPTSTKIAHSEEALVAAADSAKGTQPLLGAKKRVAGLRLVADDVEWSTGSGPEVRGPLRTLILAMVGRPPVLADLHGDGVAELRARS